MRARSDKDAVPVVEPRQAGVPGAHATDDPWDEPMRLGPIGLSALLGGVARGLPRGFRALPARGRVALGWLVLLLLLTAFGRFIAPYPADAVGVGVVNGPPMASHPIGTDASGRDVLSRLMTGTPITIVVATLAPLCALAIGGLIGTVAAVVGRRVDEVVMRLMDIQFAFPAVLLALVFANVLGPGLGTTLLVMVLVYSPIVARLVRAAVREQMALDYVTVARAQGAGTRYIVLRHVVVNIASPTLVFVTLVAADAVVLEAALSFLGAGIRPPTPSWGNLVQEGSEQMLAGNWWLTVFPGLAIFITVLALNTLAETAADRIGGRTSAVPKA